MAGYSVELAGCPSWQDTLSNLRAVLVGMDDNTEVRLIRVETDDEAVENRFVGSPTIQVDGEDVFPTEDDDFAMGCRVYVTPEGLKGVPTTDMIRVALKERVT